MKGRDASILVSLNNRTVSRRDIIGENPIIMLKEDDGQLELYSKITQLHGE